MTRGNGKASVPFAVTATTAARAGTIVISPAAGFSGLPASVRITQAATIAPRLTTTFNPNPVEAISNGCPNFLPTWRYAITLAETNGGTFNVSSWSQTITAAGGSPSTTNFPGSDFAAQFGTTRIAPNTSIVSKQIGLCLGLFPGGGTVFYTLSGTDSSGTSISYSTPALKLNAEVILQGGARP